MSAHFRNISCAAAAALMVASGTIAWPQTPPPGNPLDQQIRRIARRYPARLMLFARNLDTGATYGLNPDERVRTASTIKLPIMAAAFAAVATGTLRWTDPIALADSAKISGSGVVQELSAGVKLPLADLVNLMMVVSDNTATNMVLGAVGGDLVNSEMEKLGLHNTRVMRPVMGDNPPPAESYTRAGRDPENRRFGLGVSTPRDMVTLLEKLERGEVVDAAASRRMIEILKRQQHRDGVARHQRDTQVASKTGALDHLRSDVAIVYSKTGRIAMAITCEDIPEVDYGPDNAGLLEIAEIAEALIAGLR
jgi:beta-lactamase class A